VLTATADVPDIYIQQFWKTVKQVPNANDTIRFMVDKKEIIYTLDMFHAALKLPTKTAEKPFIPLIMSLVWKSVRYGVYKELDMAYWGFLGVGTTLDIFQNIIFIPYLEYGVLSLSGYGVLSFILCGLW
ncbi:hypothetical protein Tco_0962795, partial [Tanacetum coccineum]